MHLFEGTGQVLIVLVSHVDVLLLEMTAKKVRRKVKKAVMKMTVK